MRLPEHLWQVFDKWGRECYYSWSTREKTIRLASEQYGLTWNELRKAGYRCVRYDRHERTTP